jgi:hypothetical protein
MFTVSIIDDVSSHGGGETGTGGKPGEKPDSPGCGASDTLPENQGEPVAHLANRLETRRRDEPGHEIAGPMNHRYEPESAIDEEEKRE